MLFPNSKRAVKINSRKRKQIMKINNNLNCLNWDVQDQITILRTILVCLILNQFNQWILVKEVMQKIRKKAKGNNDNKY